jgi:hypothetical protein
MTSQLVPDVFRNDHQSLLLVCGLPKQFLGDSALLRVFNGQSAFHDPGA